jgi:hypothetical protein
MTEAKAFCAQQAVDNICFESNWRFTMADRIRSLLGHVTQGKAPALLKQTATELHQLTLDHDLEPGLIAEAARRLWNAVQPQGNHPEALQGT